MASRVPNIVLYIGYKWNLVTKVKVHSSGFQMIDALFNESPYWKSVHLSGNESKLVYFANLLCEEGTLS